MIIRQTCKVTGVTGNSITFMTDEGQALAAVVQDGTVQVGDSFVMTLQPEHQASLSMHDLARAMLNELIVDVPSPEVSHQN